MDGGHHWVSRRNGMPGVKTGGYSLIVEKILFDPDQKGRLLAFGGSSRHWNEADSFGWIWESLDDGENWTHIATLGGDLLYSEDRGEHWRKVLEGKDANFMAGDPTCAGRFYLKTREGILCCEDNAFTDIGLPQISHRSRINCDASGRVLVCQWREGRGGVWRYSPETKQWEHLFDDAEAMECRADPSDPARLMVVTTMDPFYEEADGNGIWISADDGKSWHPENAGLGMLRVNTCGFNPFDPEEIIVGSYGMGFWKARWPKSYRPGVEDKE